MKKALLWIAGVTLVVASVLGVIFAIAGYFALGTVTANVSKFSVDTLKSIDGSMAATADGLKTVNGALDAATGSILSLQSTLTSTSDAIGQSVPLIGDVGKIIGTDVVNVISSTTQGLHSARKSAEGIDGALDGLAKIPLLNLGSIRPEVPIAQSLDEIGASLAPLPAELAKISNGLRSATGNVADMQKNLVNLGQQIGQIQGSINAAKSVIASYQREVAALRGQLTIVISGLPEWLQTARTALSLVLLWLGIAQIGLFTQGLELVARARAVRPDTKNVMGPDVVK